MNPLISVIMPVYNAQDQLSEAIESILHQTYSHFELIIINDGSTDQSEARILVFEDSRIIYVSHKVNRGIVHTLNSGIELAQGAYIARMDADDISVPTRLQVQLTFLLNHQEVDICGTAVETFGMRHQIWRYPKTHEEIKSHLLFVCALAHPSVMAKKSFFTTIPYREAYRKAEDYALWVEAIETFTFANIQEVLLKYRLHSQQTGKAFGEDQKRLTDQVRTKMLKQTFPTITQAHIDLHNQIFNGEITDSKRVFTWFKTLQIQNSTLNQNTLKATLGHFWLDIAIKTLRLNKGIEKHFFTIFFKLAPYKAFNFKLLELIKFYIKLTGFLWKTK